MLRRSVISKCTQESGLCSLHLGKRRHIQCLPPGIHGVPVDILVTDIVPDPQKANLFHCSPSPKSL